MPKCIKCAKLLTKKSPGLQCSKCSKWLHASCASISADQLSVLNATDSVDWKCKTCVGGGKTKRLSCILPDIDGEEYSDSESATNHTGVDTDNMMQHILSDLRREVRQVIKEELQRTLEFYSEKIDEYEKKIQKYEKSVKEFENRCTDVQNNLKNSCIKYEILETKIMQMEQAQLSNHLEICGVNQSESEDLAKIAEKVAVAISQNPKDVVKAYRKKRNPSKVPRQGDQSPITLILREGNRDQWLEAAKTTSISATSIGQVEAGKVYLREALTPSMAFLLWKTKDELKGMFNYIWCKHGNILVRKSEKEKKIITIRTISDIEKVKSSHG